MVDMAQTVCQGFGFGFADVALVKCDLTLQVVQFDRVEIGYGQHTDTRSGKVGQCGGTQTAASDDQNMRVGELLLPFDADFVQKDVPAVPQQEFVVGVVSGGIHGKSGLESVGRFYRRRYRVFNFRRHFGKKIIKV